MLSDADALLAAVLARPADDLPRLVYADFLDETGDALDEARAKFIRVQCELAGSPKLPLVEYATTPEEARARQLWLAQRHLLDKHAKAWLAPLRAKGEALQNPGTHGQFVRGFVEAVWMPLGIYLTKSARLFARAPVTELRATRVQLPELAELAAAPPPFRLRALDLSGQPIGDDAAALLADAPMAHALEVLRLRGCGLTDAGADALAAAPPGWQPAVIDLTLNPLVSPAAWARLAERFPGTRFSDG